MTTEYETLSFNNLGKYSKFETVASMDEVIYEYIEVLRNDEQPESVIEVLRFFGRSSLRITGVSFAKYQTIIDSVGKSRSTVVRAINTLESYGMIERIPTVKNWLGRGKSRRKSVNIIAIQSSMIHQDDTTTEDVQANEDKAEEVETGSQSLFFKHNYSSYVLESQRALETAGIRNNVPYVLYDTLSRFYAGKELRKFIGIVFRAKTSKIRIEAHEDDFKTVILDVIRRYKDGSITNIEGYLYASIRKLSRGLFLTA